ncbi:MAG: hypothetical protein ACLFOY_12840 [Desulfatibacillaceae bacterium]
MNKLKKMMLKKSLNRFADQLDAEDIAYVKEVVDDPRFSRLMSHVSDGETVESEIRDVISEKG